MTDVKWAENHNIAAWAFHGKDYLQSAKAVFFTSRCIFHLGVPQLEHNRLSKLMNTVNWNVSHIKPGFRHRWKWVFDGFKKLKKKNKTATMNLHREEKIAAIRGHWLSAWLVYCCQLFLKRSETFCFPCPPPPITSLVSKKQNKTQKQPFSFRDDSFLLNRVTLSKREWKTENLYPDLD